MEKKNKIEYWYQLKDFAFLEKQTKAIITRSSFCPSFFFK